jgi:two-component system, chemotaxis family, CheB/CheR fusion protein
VVDLARPGFRFELRSALHRFFEQRLATLTLWIMGRFNGAPHRVHLQITGVTDATEVLHALVMFIEGEAIDERFISAETEQATNEVVRRLRQELELTRARLRTVREDSDAAMRSCAPPTRNCSRSTRSTARPPRSWKPARKSFSRSTRSCKPSTPS